MSGAACLAHAFTSACLAGALNAAHIPARIRLHRAPLPTASVGSPLVLPVISGLAAEITAGPDMRIRFPIPLLLALSLAAAAAAQPLAIQIFYDNTSVEPDLSADRGVATLVTFHGQRVLFDSGTKPDLFLDNLQKLEIGRVLRGDVPKQSFWEDWGGLRCGSAVNWAVLP